MNLSILILLFLIRLRTLAVSLSILPVKLLNLVESIFCKVATNPITASFETLPPCWISIASCFWFTPIPIKKSWTSVVDSVRIPANVLICVPIVEALTPALLNAAAKPPIASSVNPLASAAAKA